MRYMCLNIPNETEPLLASMPDQIQESVKAERRGILMELAEKTEKRIYSVIIKEKKIVRII